MLKQMVVTVSRKEDPSILERVAVLEANYEWIRRELNYIRKKMDKIIIGLISSTVVIVLTLILTKLV